MAGQKFVLRVGKDEGKKITAWGTMWVDADWFKMATDKHIVKAVRDLYKVAKKNRE